MAYTTIAKVRASSGFNDNTNIINDDIEEILEQAHGELMGRIGLRYVTSALSGANFTNSDAENFLIRIENLLASGYLLQDEYGTDTDQNSDGTKRVEQAQALLDRIVKGELRLYGVDGVEFATRSTKGGGTISMTCPQRDDATDPAKFTTNQKW